MFKRISKKRFITCAAKTLLILVVFSSVLVVLDRILLLKSKDGIEQIHAYYKQPEDSVDVLFVGSSHIFCHVNTGILWDDYGIPAFDLAAAEQPFWNSYYYIKEGLKTQTPELIVLDISTPGIRPTDYQPENWLITNNYGIKYGKDRYDAIKISALKDSFNRLIIPFNSTHGKYSDLSEEDFMEYSGSVNFKGFDPRETTVPFEVHDVSSITGRHELTEKEEKYLRLIISYVQEKSIPLLFVSTPYIIETAEEQEKYNYIYDIADECGVPHIDFNLLYDEMGIDFERDFAEVLHLNRSGNKKFTKYLGQYLKDNYELADHRGDKKYASWDADALYQRQDDAAYVLKYFASTNENGRFLDYLNNDNYVIFCNVPPAYEGVPDPSLIPFINAIGLSEEKLKDYGAFVLNRGQIVYESHDYDFKAGVNDGNRRMLFYRTTDKDSGYMETFVRTNGSMGFQKVTDYEKYTMPQDGLGFYVYDTVLDRAICGYTVH